MRRLRILCADDHEANQALLRACLVSLNADIIMVDDGASAVAAASGTSPDIILMDMEMPVMDGLEAVRRIRVNEQALGRARTPIVMVTAHRPDEAAAAARRAGADGFASKPLRAATLLAAIAAASAACAGRDATLTR